MDDYEWGNTVEWCPPPESNRHSNKGTGFWILRVYQFRQRGTNIQIRTGMMGEYSIATGQVNQEDGQTPFFGQAIMNALGKWSLSPKNWRQFLE